MKKQDEPEGLGLLFRIQAGPPSEQQRVEANQRFKDAVVVGKVAASAKVSGGILFKIPGDESCD